MKKVSRAALIRNMDGKMVRATALDYVSEEQLKQQLEESIAVHNEKKPEFKVKLKETGSLFEIVQEKTGYPTGQYYRKPVMPEIREGKLNFRSRDAVFTYGLKTHAPITSFIPMKDIEVISETEFHIRTVFDKVISYTLI